jgi:Zn-finger nucleic acid-binding protein
MKVVPHRDYFVCDYCSNFHFPKESPDGVKILGKRSKLKCPNCRLALISGSVDNRRLLQCKQCHGLLMRMAEFAEVVHCHRPLARTPAVMQEILDEPRRHLLCPRCRQWLERHPYYGGPAHLLINTCERCNLIWLDRGVLAALRQC